MALGELSRDDLRRLLYLEGHAELLEEALVAAPVERGEWLRLEAAETVQVGPPGGARVIECDVAGRHLTIHRLEGGALEGEYAAEVGAVRLERERDQLEPRRALRDLLRLLVIQ